MLLSDGSGLTSRQTARLLHADGHTVGVVSPDPIALARWTKAVRQWHRVPRFGDNPIAWLEAATRIAVEGRYDVVLPTQEQVTVISWAIERGVWPAQVGTAVPGFEALRQVQDKLAAAQTLARLHLRRPRWSRLGEFSDALTWTHYPAYVKVPVGTASSGVRRVSGPAELYDVLDTPAFASALETSGVLVEEAIRGPLVMIQSVFDHGQLLAFHVNRRDAEGAGGGASRKRSIDLPALRETIETVGGDLAWHGALSADAVLGPTGPVIIDINPRLVEPGNAWCSGVDLVGTLLALCAGSPGPLQPTSRPDVHTHQLLLAVLGAAEHTGSRRAVWAEALTAVRRQGAYRDSREELTPGAWDPLSAVPVVVALALTSVRPRLGRLLAASSTGAYAITPEGWAQLGRCTRADDHNG